MKYLVLHTVRLIVLFEGDKVTEGQSMYSKEEMQAVMGQLEKDNLEAVNNFLREKLGLLKKCDYDNLR